MNSYIPKVHTTNKELMAEIAKSKLSYCSYLDSDHALYDVIVTAPSPITSDILAEGLLQRQRRDPLATMADVVVRFMTMDHIPDDLTRARKGRNADRPDIAWTPFPPFKHVMVREGVEVEVLRLHWIGGFENGCFSPDHGRMTDRLGRALMLMCERYASRGNFRGYSYADEMVASALVHLCQVALQFNESKGSNPFAFYTSTIHHVFVRILNEDKKNQALRDDLLEMGGVAPSLTRQMEAEFAGKFPGLPAIKGRGPRPRSKVS